MSTVANCICLHTLITIRKRSFAKVMFLEVSVSGGGGLQAHTQKGVWGSPRPYPGGRLRGLIGGESPGPYPAGRLGVWPGGSPGGPDSGGGSRPRYGGVSQNALRQTPHPQPSTTAADGTHPTGMHSCF